MPIETIFYFTLIISALFCALVAGFVFAFTTVIMPGISKFNDAQFLQSFKAIDAVIQENQVVFMLVWIGSIVGLMIAAISAFFVLEGVTLLIMMTITGMYILGVQLPTIIINIPLNNQVKALNIISAEQHVLSAFRQSFESRWNKSNSFRTVIACFTTLLMLILLLML